MPTFRFSNQPMVNYHFTSAGIDEERAKRAFEAVSKAMDPGDRAAIRNYWFQHQGAPTFTLEDTFLLTGKRDDGPYEALGENVTGKGLAFRFAGLAMHHMPDILVETLIAHEIAHAVIFREIQESDLPEEEDAIYKSLGADLGSLTAWNEAAVNRRTMSWNPLYNDKKVRDWLDYYRKHKAPPPLSATGLPAPEPVPLAEVLPPVAAAEAEYVVAGNHAEVDAPPPQSSNLLLMLAVIIGGLALLAFLLWLLGVI